MEYLKKFISKQFKNEVRAHLKLKRKEATFTDYPENLNNELKQVLQADGIERLYSHQVEAFNSISNNLNTLLVSHTASGKTLSFFLLQ